MKTFSITVIIASLILVACQKVVDADKLLDTEERVYITSYISPQDTVLRVNVSKALASVGTTLSVNDYEANLDKFLIKNAEVSISNESDETASLVYSQEHMAYLANASDLNIFEGQSYFLKVVVADQVFTASCSIPKQVEEINEVITIKNSDFGTDADINLSFKDISGERNYYVLGGRIKYTELYEGETYFYDYPLWFDTDEFLTDNLEDGSILNGKTINYLGDLEYQLETKITLQVANVEEILYQNLVTNATNYDAEDNPFVEYAIAPTNFEQDGVVGVFAGYQLTQKEVEIED